MVDLTLGRPKGRERGKGLESFRRGSRRTSLGPALRLERSSWRWLANVLPPWLLDLVRGPATRLVISPDRTATVAKRYLGRPVDVEIHPDLVLTDHMTIPVESRRDIRHAVALRIESETPFSMGELLVSVAAGPDTRDGLEIALTIDMVPIAALNSALRATNLAANRIRSIEVGPSLSLDHVIRFPTPSRPTAVLGGIAALLPILILGAAATASILTTSDQIAQRAEAAESQGSSLLKEVKGLETELQARGKESAARQEYEQLFTASESSFLLLNAFKHAIPPGTAVTKVDISNGVLTLSVRAPDVLATVAAMNSRAGWKAAVNGTITTDPVTRLESADIALRISV